MTLAVRGGMLFAISTAGSATVTRLLILVRRAPSIAATAVARLVGFVRGASALRPSAAAFSTRFGMLLSGATSRPTTVAA